MCVFVAKWDSVRDRGVSGHEAPRAAEPQDLAAVAVQGTGTWPATLTWAFRKMGAGQRQNMPISMAGGRGSSGSFRGNFAEI